MIKVTYWGRPKRPIVIEKYTLYVSTCKGKRQKWAGECNESIEIENRINRYIQNNDYVSAKIVCCYDAGCFVKYVKYTR